MASGGEARSPGPAARRDARGRALPDRRSGPRRGRRHRRRIRLLTRLLPIILLAVAAFVIGFRIAGSGDRAERETVRQYARDWTKGDFSAMYAMLTPGSRRHLSLIAFNAAYAQAAAKATLLSLKLVSVGHRHGDIVPVKMRATTRAFGSLTATLEVSLSGQGSSSQIRFTPALLFPGLRGSEALDRTVTLGDRGSILADDGTPLASGPSRSSPIPDVAGQIAGAVGPIPPGELTSYEAQGYPPDAKVGTSGLELALQPALAGTPGGILRAGGRILAERPPVNGATVKTTIDPTIERAMIASIGGRYAGMVAMDPRTGGLLGLAGVAYSALQPPGSTMKIVTVSAALQAGLTHLGEVFPYMTGIPVDGFTIQNANGESCGGTLLLAFATSCNSVFAPLGARIGGARLVSMAEKFGFNQVPPIPGAATSSIPSAADIGDSLAVASSAIGQGMVQATALEMTDVAATIAMGGRRPLPTLTAGQPPRFTRVISAHVAKLVQQMMIAVVREGTGTAAQISGVVVAGKTGTAELRSTVANPNDPNAVKQANSPANTDAWFVGYAPVGAPRVVVGALFPEQGAGGATAAPAVQPVLVTALEHHR